jgi:hypothetical protein
MVSQRGSNVNGSGPPGNVLLADPVSGRSGAARTAGATSARSSIATAAASFGRAFTAGADPDCFDRALTRRCIVMLDRAVAPTVALGGEHDQGEYRIPSPPQRRSRAVTWGVAGESRRRGSNPDLSAWIDVAPRVLRGDQLDAVQPADLGGHRQQAGGNATHPGTGPPLDEVL